MSESKAVSTNERKQLNLGLVDVQKSQRILTSLQKLAVYAMEEGYGKINKNEIAVDFLDVGLNALERWFKTALSAKEAYAEAKRGGAHKDEIKKVMKKNFNKVAREVLEEITPIVYQRIDDMVEGFYGP